jgi:hypothetical protein
MPTRGTSTERGYGTEHRKRRAALLAAFVDGTPCPYCHEPMRRGQSLDADHSVAIKHGGTGADRLSHAKCNRSAGRYLGQPVIKCQFHPACGSIHSRAW